MQILPDDPSAIRPLGAAVPDGHGRVIAFEFSVYGEDGERLGGNAGANPRIFQVGANEMLPALERELVTMQENENRTIVLSPEEAYGPVLAEAFRAVPLESIPKETRHVGRKVMGRAPDGSEEIFDVVEVHDDEVVLDMNHPMAGRTLRFEVKVLHR
jgi:FKBP-type peptidyl-prolyl cis-trans isomerase 2